MKTIDFFVAFTTWLLFIYAVGTEVTAILAFTISCGIGWLIGATFYRAWKE